MTFPSAVASDDPDPTSQMAWPTRRQTNEPASPVEYRSPLDLPQEQIQAQLNGRETRADAKRTTVDQDLDDIGKRRLSAVDLFNLTVSMAGAQIAWTVELGYGTPFLLTLGLSEQLTSLVWLAGPISGLIAQPLIGAISDSSRSRYRRRFWIATSTAVLVLATVMLAYCKEIAAGIVDVLGAGLGDWDPESQKLAARTAIGLAVLAFYLLDFSLNALQASLRNLLLDVTPQSQLNAGNAWHGRMMHAGNIIGYGFGFLPLAQFPLLRLLGGTQFRKFCIVAMVILVITVVITCVTQEEKPGKEDFKNKKHSRFVDVVRNIWVAIVNLPKPIRRVCYVQIFAYMGWFPFLFYATTYIGQVMAKERNEEPDEEEATRMGYLALLWFSLVAVIAGTLLPQLASRDQRLLASEEEESEDAELARIKNQLREWRAEAARKGKPLKLPAMPFMLRNIWCGAMVLFTLITFATFFITTVIQAIIAVSLIGICWAVACWVPFAIIMEFLKELDEDNSRKIAPLPTKFGKKKRNHYRAVSSPSVVLWRTDSFDERQPLVRRLSLTQQTEEAPQEKQEMAGGTVLGIHNLAIVMPQFLVAICSSVIFRVVDGNQIGDENHYLGKNGVAWVLRFGGLCGLMGALVARKVPPTQTEREMRRRLGEMEVLRRAGSP